MIIKSSKLSKQEPPRIKNTTISTILNKALRIKRLLEIASGNYNIIDAFPDLDPNLFMAKKMGVVNFERWLELVKTGNTITFEEGKQLYENFKVEIKKQRAEKLKKIYQK